MDRPEPTFADPQYTVNDSTAPNPRRSHDSQRQTSQPPGGPRYSLPSYNVNNARTNSPQHNGSDEEGTVYGDHEKEHEKQRDKENVQPPTSPSQQHPPPEHRRHSLLTVHSEYEHGEPLAAAPSVSQTREQGTRLGDDLEMLKVERQISRMADGRGLSRTRSSASGDNPYRSRSRRRDDTVDDFDEATNPVHEKTQAYKPLEHPVSSFGKLVRRVHQSNFIVRWFTYILPVGLILLIPILLGRFMYPNATVGGVYLMWFSIWLEIVWLTLWAGRVLAKLLPWPIGVISSLFTNNSKKWRDMGKQLELPATLFFWWLAIEVSFLPTMLHKQKDEPASFTPNWMVITNKVLVSFFVAAILNFIEKIIIQLIAISFHLRTYADRIELNKFQIGSLTKLYKFSREKIAMEDYEFEQNPNMPGSGARTPGQLVTDAAKTTKAAFTKFGDVAGKVAGDFTGRQTTKSTHPSQVVLALLSSINGSQVLARRLYRTFAREETETVFPDDLKDAFENEEEAEAAFSMFDKDMNGDISMEELEAVCVEIGRERKAITASLKDLDSVVGTLDDMFMFIVFIIVVLVFISLISTSAATAITSAGSAVLALSWLFSATAQELLQSIIFVFVKHPFDVGDRVSIYGNTGTLGKGDDYFVKEISLLYTEFKKMEGHVVQAPNSYLNTLFILNQRRSGGLAEAVSITIKFGTTLEQIDGLRQKLLDFVTAEKREYQGKILTELRDIVEVHSMNLNVVFFYKSNWQNEGLRLARRNRFISGLMVAMQEMGIEGPYMRFPGMKQSFPMYLSNVPHAQVPGTGQGGHPDRPYGFQPDELREEPQQDPPFVAPLQPQDTNGSQSRARTGSVFRPSTRNRGESLSQMNKRVDFSLGMNRFAGGDLDGDVFEDRNRNRIPIEITEASRDREQSRLRTVQEEKLRASLERTRTSSRDSRFAPGAGGGLVRRSTENAGRMGSIHRNRFFSRGTRGGDDPAMMENGMMADIPENPGSGGNGTPTQRIDPRSGLISPAAIHDGGSTPVRPPHVRTRSQTFQG